MSDDNPEAVPYGERAVWALVTRYGEPALAMVMKCGLSRADAETVVADAYLALIKKWAQRGSLVAAERLLFKVVRQRLANEFRRRGRKPVSLVDSDDGVAMTAEAVWKTAFADSLVEKVDVSMALYELPCRQRAVLELRMLHDLEIEIVAELLGCTANSVKYAQKIGLANLKKSRWLSGYSGATEGQN